MSYTMRKMTTRFLQVLALAVVLLPGLVNAQIIFSEDFDGIGGPTSGGAGTYTFPAGWRLRNVDNGTPATAVSYVNEAWERREDFSFAVGDSVAFSTSWYSPAGTANDWMWTPLTATVPAGASLFWNAVTYDASYPDGYEVRVMTSAAGPPTGSTGVIGNQITSSTSIFSIAAENTTWTSRSVSLAAYAGQQIYVGFRNNSTDEFLLLIDDVRIEAPVTNDAEMVGADTLEYTIIPLRQYAGIPFNGTIRNGGSNNLVGTYMTVNVYDGAGGLIWTGNSTPGGTLTPGSTTNATVTGWAPTAADFYTFEYIAKHSVADGQAIDDTLYRGVLVDTDVYARDDGTVTGGVGIGAGVGGYLGQEFDIAVGDIIDSILVYVTTGYTGEPLACSIYPMVSGAPTTTPIATTDTLTYVNDSAGVYVLPMSGGAWAAAPGTYMIAFEEFDSTMQIGQTASIFTAGDHWVYWSSIGSGVPTQIETFGGAFARASVIRPYFNCGDYNLDFVNVDAGCGAATGSSTVSIAAGEPVIGTPTYLWNTGSTSATLSGVVAGTYTVTVTVGGTCEVVETTTINNVGAGSIDSVMVADALCNGDDGMVAITVSGGTPGYTYLWSNGSTAAFTTDVAGSYTVTITDAAGCVINGGPYVISEPIVLGATVTHTDETTAGASDGTATANVSGGSTPYTYLWSNGATTSSISGLAPGTYCVTVTDANGCDTTACSDVITGIAAPTTQEPVSMGLYPNPNNGTFHIFINSLEPTSMDVQVIDRVGKVIWTESVGNSTAFSREINLEGAADGIYFIRVSALDKTVVHKIVVNR
jgi:hypothetical protein